MNKLTLLFCFLILISCKKEVASSDINLNKSVVTKIQKHDAIIPLEREVIKEVSDWEEYNNFNKFIKKYQAISSSEAQNNAVELNVLVKSLKTNIRPKPLLTPSFRTRVHVLENEILRLRDMTFIPAIKTEEVNQQVTKILAAFSATNSKINAVFIQKRLNSEMNIEINIVDPLKKKKERDIERKIVCLKRKRKKLLR